MNGERKYNIPSEATMDVIGGKWKVIVLCHLSYGPKRTSEIKKQMPDITQKMLTQTLRELEEDGIITRTVFNQVPPKVVYELSELGDSLQPILDQICDWGEKYLIEKTKVSTLEGNI
ncbi:helix-turn-helix domain-containing protein [Bifidobacterium pullorum subsp. gallinarum]